MKYKRELCVRDVWDQTPVSKTVYYSCIVDALVEIVSCSNLFLFQSHNVKVCDIDDDVKDALKKFRFRKTDTNAALISKCIL